MQLHASRGKRPAGSGWRRDVLTRLLAVTQRRPRPLVLSQRGQSSVRASWQASAQGHRKGHRKGPTRRWVGGDVLRVPEVPGSQLVPERHALTHERGLLTVSRNEGRGATTRLYRRSQATLVSKSPTVIVHLFHHIPIWHLRMYIFPSLDVMMACCPAHFWSVEP